MHRDLLCMACEILLHACTLFVVQPVALDDRIDF
jgi:hypothetical protein